MISKLIAKLLVEQTMIEAATDKHEEKIKLVKRPGKKNAAQLAIRVSFECQRDRIPIYVDKIVDAAATATDVSYEEMLKHLKTTHDLIGEMSQEKIQEEDDEEMCKGGKP